MIRKLLECKQLHSMTPTTMPIPLILGLGPFQLGLQRTCLQIQVCFIAIMHRFPPMIFEIFNTLSFLILYVQFSNRSQNIFYTRTILCTHFLYSFCQCVGVLVYVCIHALMWGHLGIRTGNIDCQNHLNVKEDKQTEMCQCPSLYQGVSIVTFTVLLHGVLTVHMSIWEGRPVHTVRRSHRMSSGYNGDLTHQFEF